MPAPSVQLKVNGAVYSGWTEVTIKQSIKALSGSFDLSMTDQWDAKGQAWPIVPGDECELLLNGHLLIDGFIDDVDNDVDGSSHRIRAAGRDSSADLVDCSAIIPGGGLNVPMNIVSLANLLGKPYGVTASANVPTGEPLADLYRDGQTAFELIARGARQRGLLMISDGKGGILFTRTAKKSSGALLKQGVNLKAFGTKFSFKARFSNYVVVYPLATSASDPGVPSHKESEATDPDVDRFRQLTIVEQSTEKDQVSANARARWEAASRAGKSENVTVTVAGFTKPDGSLWTINELASVDIPFLRIKKEMLIADVTFSFGPAGTVTTLGLARPDAYLNEPLQDGSGLTAAVRRDSR